LNQNGNSRIGHRSRDRRRGPLDLSLLDRSTAMSARIAAPLLRIPPFPNAARRHLAQPDPDAAIGVSDVEVDRIAAALAKARVGGTYWAAQPPVPGTPYTLLRLADPDIRAETIDDLVGERLVVSWTGLKRHRKVPREGRRNSTS
jgi:hypothetical protein